MQYFYKHQNPDPVNRTGTIHSGNFLNGQGLIDYLPYYSFQWTSKNKKGIFFSAKLINTSIYRIACDNLTERFFQQVKTSGQN